jgi:hypothetical protein
MDALEESDYAAVITELGKSGMGVKEVKRGALLAFQDVLS